MRPRFQIHTEPVSGHLAWWAESDEIPGLSLAADSLPELRSLIEEAVIEHLGEGTEVDLALDDDLARPVAPTPTRPSREAPTH
jgi:hypothetical protein